MRYFIVTAKCGHVGRTNCVLINFPVVAEDARTAAGMVRNFRRVKHHHKDAIKYVTETDLDGYLAQKEINNRDPYLCCRNVQEQNRIQDLADRIVPDEWNRKRLLGYSAEKHDPEYARAKYRISEKDGRLQIREYEEDLDFCS